MNPEPRLENLGEDAVVSAITCKLPKGPDVRVGAGDDCAVVGPKDARHWSLLKTDAMIEGVHFLSETEPRRVGWKALCRAISDIAAMGGTPQHALITIALSPKTPLRWVEEFYDGLKAAAKQHGVSIVGGETSRSPGPAFINISLTGTVRRKECVLRSGGSPGDILFVTGTLGGSLSGRHLDFTPRVAEAQFLASKVRPSAMMDLSDGLAADLPRLARASGCSFHVDMAQIPKTADCTLQQALSDGEDFELLFAISSRKVRQLLAPWRRAFPKVPLTRIGKLLFIQESSTVLHAHGYDHFA
jgi:thiamine-monophosphate kinase